MKIILLGPQGSGKGTVGRILAKELHLPIVENGKLLRALPESHPRYAEINDLMNKGELVPQDFMAELLRDTVSKDEYSKGYLSDGWGRALIDLKLFDPNYDLALVFNLSRESSVKRITGRRICSTDGKVYNILTLPKEQLDECKGDLIQRPDDTPEAVNRRLDIYYSDTQKVIDVFKAEGKLIEVDAEPLPDVVAQEALAKIRKFALDNNISLND